MQIKLEYIVPLPLKDKLGKRKSDVWNKEIIFSPGEFIKITAPSGTGKTTLVHILYKLRNDYEGSVWYDSADMKKISVNDIAALRQKTFSIVFQDLRLFPNISARENIELKRVLQQPYYTSDIIDAMAERLNVTHVLNQKAGICSYGEQQRIAIIRSLVQPFNWLIMDEPFSHLDHENIQRVADLIREEVQKRNAGIILTDLEDDSHFIYTKQLNL